MHEDSATLRVSEEKKAGQMTGPTQFLRLTVLASVSLAVSQGLNAQEQRTPSSDVKAKAHLALEVARTESAQFEPAAQAAVLYLVGRALSKEGPTQAKRDLEQAFDLILRAATEQDFSWQALASGIVGQTTLVSPDYVEANLPKEQSLRNVALGRLVQHKLATKQLASATALQKQMTGEIGVYIAARQIMQSLPESASPERADIFANLLLNYRRTPHPNSTIGYPEDLSTLIVRFWKQLPRDLVKEAVDEVLKQAAEKTAGNAESIAASSPAGTITFSSAYEFRAFQMLPVLKVVDPARADALQKELQKVKELLAQYPQGQQSLDPTLRDTPLRDGEMRQVRYVITPKGGQAGEAAAALEANRQGRQIESELKEKPADAIATAASIPDPNERGASLVRIASTLAESQPQLAASALRRLLESRELRPVRNPAHFIKGAEILVRIDRPDDARKLLNAALVEVRREYQDDRDPENPNRALKLFWGSTHGWRDIIAVAAKISDQDALDIIKDIPDEEIQSLERVMLAGIWLDVTVWRETSPMVSKKKN